MGKLLVTGASGLLGWNLCRVARHEWDVYGIAHRNHNVIEGVKLRLLDLNRFREVREIIREVHPDAIIHAAAASKPNFCELNPRESCEINVQATASLASLCADLFIPFVFISTDLVFDGLNPPYREDDPVSPVCLYGEQKAEAESAVLAKCPRSVICRMSLMFGDTGPGAIVFIQEWIKDMRNGRELKLFTDEYRTPISALDAARGILLALSQPSGILHIGGPERISRFDFGKLLQEVTGLHNARLFPCKQESIQMPAQRPPDVSLGSSKARMLGFRLGSLRKELEKLDCIRLESKTGQRINS